MELIKVINLGLEIGHFRLIYLRHIPLSQILGRQIADCFNKIKKCLGTFQPPHKAILMHLKIL
jgi:hypothetical protein